MALLRVFEFTADAKGRGDFRLAYEAFRGRGPEKITKDERRSAAELQEALEAISDPIGSLPDEADIDVRFRRLKEDGGTITVPQRVFELLQTWIDDAQFQAGVSAQATALRDRLGAAEKQETDQAEEPKRPRLAHGR